MKEIRIKIDEKVLAAAHYAAKVTDTPPAVVYALVLAEFERNVGPTGFVDVVREAQIRIAEGANIKLVREV
jgi:hypothetical protein